MSSRHHFFLAALLVLALALCAHGQASQAEKDAIYTLGQFFNMGFSNSSISTLCSSNGQQPGLTGVYCSSFGTDGLHVNQFYAQTAASQTTLPTGLTDLVYLRTLYIIQYSGSLTNLDIVGSLTNLTYFYFFSYVSNPHLADISRLTSLTTLNWYPYYGQQVPLLAGLSQLRTAYIQVGAGRNTFVPLPANMFEGLTQLTTLQVSSSSNYGFTSIPDFSNCTQLRTLRLSNNKLNNTYLASLDFTRFPYLSSLDVSGNRALSKLPSSVGSLATLYTLTINNCNFSSSDSLPDLSATSVINVYAASNNIVNLQNSWCQLSNNTASYGNYSIDLSSNPLTTVPTCFWAQPFRGLQLGNTHLPTFPTALFNSYMEYFYWYGNDMVLPISSWTLDKWAVNMYDLELVGIGLSGPFPVGLKTFANLQYIYFGSNQLTGTLPDDFFSNMPNLYVFSAGYNLLTGAFPTSISATSGYMEYLEVPGNQFTTLPSVIGACQQLYYIDFSDNLLTSIPPTNVWANLTALQYIYIGGNRHLTGTLPQSWFNYPIYAVNASSCSFSGDHPALNSTYFYQLYLSDNILDGTIKEPIQITNNFYEWRFDQNGLTGSLPASLGNSSGSMDWSSLYIFNASYNRLTGTLPPSFNSLSNMQYLDLNNNGFHGDLPDFSSLYNVNSFNGGTNFFNVCAIDPHVTNLDPSRCSVTSNLYPGACYCPEFFDGYCFADTACPAPGTPPVSIPPFGDAPTPIRPPSLIPEAPTTGANGNHPTGSSCLNRPSVIVALAVVMIGLAF